MQHKVDKRYLTHDEENQFEYFVLEIKKLMWSNEAKIETGLVHGGRPRAQFSTK